MGFLDDYVVLMGSGKGFGGIWDYVRSNVTLADLLGVGFLGCFVFCDGWRWEFAIMGILMFIVSILRDIKRYLIMLNKPKRDFGKCDVIDAGGDVW